MRKPYGSLFEHITRLRFGCLGRYIVFFVQNVYTLATAHADLSAVVAQLVRAPACHAGGCGFKSRLPRSIKKPDWFRSFLYQRKGLESRNDAEGEWGGVEKILLKIIRDQVPSTAWWTVCWWLKKIVGYFKKIRKARQRRAFEVLHTQLFVAITNDFSGEVESESLLGA